MRRILITGVTGFVGHHVAASFLTRFAGIAEIYGVGRDPRPNSLLNGVHYVAADLSDPRVVRELVAGIGPTDILHLAALSSVFEASSKPAAAWEGNVVNLIHLAAAVVEQASPANVYFTSSGEVYGRSFLSGQPLSETAAPMPVSTYAKAKLVGEQILTDVLGKADGVRLVIFRPFNHTGPGQTEQFVVPSFAGQIARVEAGLGSPVLEVGDLSAKRDFLDVRDVVDAYGETIAASDSLEKVSVYNVCSGQARSIESILSSLVSLSRAPLKVRVAADRLRPSEIPTACGDASAIASCIGWEPRWPFHDTLVSVLNHARASLGGR